MKNLKQPQKTILALVNWTFLPLMTWLTRSAMQDDGTPTFPPPGPPQPYTPADARINPMVVMAAQGDTARALETDPEGHQAELNACMESIEAGPIKDGMISMFGAMVAAGRRPDDAIVRVCANFLLLGIYVERRLNSEPPFPSSWPPGQDINGGPQGNPFGTENAGGIGAANPLKGQEPE